jgi:hypothetical protein
MRRSTSAFAPVVAAIWSTVRGPSASAVDTPSLATTYSACDIWKPASIGSI